MSSDCVYCSRGIAGPMAEVVHSTGIGFAHPRCADKEEREGGIGRVSRVPYLREMNRKRLEPGDELPMPEDGRDLLERLAVGAYVYAGDAENGPEWAITWRVSTELCERLREAGMLAPLTIEGYEHCYGLSPAGQAFVRDRED